jgi:hypothetical protein
VGYCGGRYVLELAGACDRLGTATCRSQVALRIV